MLIQKRPQGIREPHINCQTSGESRLKRRGHGSHSADVLQKLYFSTSSSAALPEHNTSEVELSHLPSMKSFNQGAGYHKSELPGPRRSDCAYSAQFVSMPLDDVAATRELRGMIAASSMEGSSGNKVVEGLSLSSDTTNKAFYGKDRKRAEPVQIVKPECAIRIRPDAQFLVSKSVFQRDFKEYNQELQQKSRREIIRNDGNFISRSPVSFEGVSSYKRAFGKDRQDPMAKLAGKSKSMGVLRCGYRADRKPSYLTSK
jgi:hypothetical protein